MLSFHRALAHTKVKRVGGVTSSLDSALLCPHVYHHHPSRSSFIFRLRVPRRIPPFGEDGRMENFPKLIEMLDLVYIDKPFSEFYFRNHKVITHLIVPQNFRKDHTFQEQK